MKISLGRHHFFAVISKQFWHFPGTSQYPLILILNRSRSPQKCFIKKLFLKISKNWQENICVRVSLACNLVKKRIWRRCFPANFGTSPVNASVFRQLVGQFLINVPYTRYYGTSPVNASVVRQLVGQFVLNVPYTRH